MRLKYHFEPKKGWINDPNGLAFYKGRYHAFFQHYPYAPKWGQMHWGHAVSDDLLHWEELPIALYPDRDYENSGGCFSGSAIEKDGKLYLFYTSVSNELGQTQSMAMSDDGFNFVKYENNPIIKKYPDDGSVDFRDPKVSFIDGKYYMVCGSGKDGCGKILLFSSDNLFDWKYEGVLFEGKEYGHVLECPDFFKYGDKYVLMFSQMGRKTHSTMFVYGDFDGQKLTPISMSTPEAGPDFYAPQTFLDGKGRRIIIGWMNSWDRKIAEDAEYAGAFTIPRELTVHDGNVHMFPVKEAGHLLINLDNDVYILKDTQTVETFIKNGRFSFTYWFD